MNQFKITEADILERKAFLIDTIGLSQMCVQKMRKITNALCCSEKVEQRIENLKSLGFSDPVTFLEVNPHMIFRTRKTVTKHFWLARAWLVLFDRDIDIHALLQSRSQLWSVSENKLIVVSLLAAHCLEGISPGRVCDLITLNLENLLLTYTEHPKAGCGLLCKIARKQPKTSLDQKRKLIMNQKAFLPPIVFTQYKKRFLS